MRKNELKRIVESSEIDALFAQNRQRRFREGRSYIGHQKKSGSYLG